MNRNSFYNKNFNISLPAIAIILTIQSNIVISFGMVGALSIVRFGTAIKEPMDLVFLFCSIRVGIQSSIVKAPQILLVNSNTFENEDVIIEVVRKYCSLHKVKAGNLTHDHLDMAIEVRVKEEGKLVKELMTVQNVTVASLVANEGKVTF